MSGEMMSRRELFRRFASRLDSLRSEPTSEKKALVITDRAIEPICEFTVIALALHAAMEGGQDKLLTLKPQPTETISSVPAMQNAYESKIIPIAEQTGASAAANSNLYSEWSRAYYKSRTETYTALEEVCSGSGKKEVCDLVPVTRTRIIYYWDEPAEFISKGLNNGTISGWQNKLNDFGSRLNNVLALLPNAPTFSRGNDSINFEVQSIDQTSRTNLLGVGFGVSAGLFAFYEEIFEHIAKSQPDVSEFWTTLSDRKIKRRSMLKLGLGAIAVSKIQDIQKNIAIKNSGLLNEVTDKTHEYIAGMDISAPQVFENWFGISVDNVMGFIDQIKSVTTSALNAGSNNTADWANIQPLLQGLLNNVTNVQNICRQQFRYETNGQYDLSSDFISAIKKVSAYEQIKNFVNGKNAEANTSAVAQVAIFAGLLLGISISSEVATEASDKALNHFLE